MPSDPVPTQDATFKGWSKNFSTFASANASTLKLSLPQAAALEAAVDNYGTAYDAAEASKATTKGLVVDKKLTRKTAESLVRSYAKQFLADPSIPAPLKGQLGLNAGVTPIGPVAVPNDLKVTGLASGTNVLRWKRNGNASGTVFIVEAKIGSAAAFTMIAVTSSSKFDHVGQTPGMQAVYRVSAKRGASQSQPSTEVIVYSGGTGSPFLQVAA